MASVHASRTQNRQKVLGNTASLPIKMLYFPAPKVSNDPCMHTSKSLESAQMYVKVTFAKIDSNSHHFLGSHLFSLKTKS